MTNLAVRSNTVIYTFDARGLDARLFSDASDLSSPPVSGDANVAYSVKAAQAFESQDALSNIAYNTGGVFVHNTNDLPGNLARLSEEAFRSYMLSWEPETEPEKTTKFYRIEVAVKGHPEWEVRVQNGYLADSMDIKKDPPVKTDKSRPVKASKTEGPDPLIDAAKSPSRKSQLPTSLSLKFLNFANDDASLWATVQLSSDTIVFTENENSSRANVEIAGLIYNADGRLEKSFKPPLSISVASAELRNGNAKYFNYEYKTALKPGLYQIRVSSRDKASGKIGSFSRWIEIPDISGRRLTLSSLVLGELKSGQTVSKPNTDTKVHITLAKNISNRFDRTSIFRYGGFIYNAMNTSDGRLSIDVELLQNGMPVLKGMPNFVPLDGKDSERLAFIGTLDFTNLPPGAYELIVNAKDQLSKAAAARRINVEIY